MHIKLDPDGYNLIGARHGSRRKRPEEGNVWDFDMGLDRAYLPIGRQTAQFYFGDNQPKVILVSKLPRTYDTADCWWPEYMGHIGVWAGLGTTEADIAAGKWSKIDAVPDCYDASMEQLMEADPFVMLEAGFDWFDIGRRAAFAAGLGNFATTFSHAGNADFGVMVTRRLLGYRVNNALLPQKFESGGFVHIVFDAGGFPKSCEYYPPIRP